LADFVRRMDAERTVAVISMPGDRSDGDMNMFGELAGKTFDRIIIREDDNTRGRAPGEIASILKDAVIRGGRAEADVEIVLDELEASKTAVDTSNKSDLVVLMIDKPLKVWTMLTTRNSPDL
jgi:cyanophycin synthetase